MTNTEPERGREASILPCCCPDLCYLASQGHKCAVSAATKTSPITRKLSFSWCLPPGTRVSISTQQQVGDPGAR